MVAITVGKILLILALLNLSCYSNIIRKGQEILNNIDNYKTGTINIQLDGQLIVLFGYLPNGLNASETLTKAENEQKCFSIIRERDGSFGKMFYLQKITIWICPKIKIEESKETIISIEPQGTKLEWKATLKQWIPGILYLAPLFFGSAVLKQDINVRIVNSLRQETLR